MVDVLTPVRFAELRTDTARDRKPDACQTSAHVLIAYRNHLLAELRHVERELDALMREPED